MLLEDGGFLHPPHREPGALEDGVGYCAQCALGFLRPEGVRACLIQRDGSQFGTGGEKVPGQPSQAPS